MYILLKIKNIFMGMNNILYNSTSICDFCEIIHVHIILYYGFQK